MDRSRAAMRALSAISLHHPAHLTACFATLYTTFWVHRNPISQPQTWTAALTSVLGETSTREIVRLAGEAEAKELLKANTDLAVREGAFGLPWFVATDAEGRREGFWGFDHLGQVVDFLGLERRDEGFRAML
ncbi:hypothetical protein B0A55_06525 [Friedmanniomyces simplex]|uniref:DSBA-like thioredoxin domain-containing protein n=1 Tax=Friedmanniomyces simplex TaxID=329884 RepID=A0A4U0X8P0_9PEZI|nr:hypothetical protein B0A55_06525 [Friedmanniomyces simplex]